MDDVQRELNGARARGPDEEEARQLAEVLEAQERVVHLVYGKCARVPCLLGRGDEPRAFWEVASI